MGADTSDPERSAPEESFDQRLDRLEQIVSELEDGELGLEPAIGRYREGVALVAECREVLAGFQRQVEELTRGVEGASEGASTRPYAGDPDLPDAPGEGA